MNDEIFKKLEETTIYLETHFENCLFKKNQVILDVINKIYKLDCVITDNEKIIETTPKYERLLGLELTESFKKNHSNTCSMKINGLDLKSRKGMYGILYGTALEYSDKEKGFLFVKFNKKTNPFIINLINELVKYVYL